jgi:Immunity protein 8
MPTSTSRTDPLVGASIDIKRLYSLDLPGPYDEPEDPGTCWIRVNADIGLKDSDAADTFRLIVCTPAGLAQERESAPTWGAHLLVLSRFDWEIVKSALVGKIAEVGRRATSWDDFVRRFACYAEWEYEDFEDEYRA